MEATEGIDKFRAWVLPILGGYPAIEFRSLAFVKDGATHNLYTKATLLPVEQKTPKHRRIQAHPAFRIAEDILSSESLPSILDGLAQEVLRLPDVTVQLATPNVDQTGKILPQTGPIWWHAMRDQSEVFFWAGRSYSAEPTRKYSLSSNGGAGRALVSESDWENLNSGLLGARPRWLGIPDLVKGFLKVDHQWSYHYNTEILVELPLQCEIGYPQLLDNGRLSVRLAAPSKLSENKLRLSALLVKRAKGRIERDSRVKRVTASDASGRSGFEGSIAVSDSNSVTLHLLLDNQVVAKAAYDLPAGKTTNPRMKALQSLGDSVSRLDAVLLGGKKSKKDAHSLEVTVAALLAAGGFITLHPGSKDAKAGEVVDVIAFHPFAPLAFCIECTLGPAGNKDKIAKLEMRKQEIAKVIGDYTVEAIGVVAADEISAVDLAEAHGRGVILLNKAHLRELRKKVEWDLGPSTIAKWLRGNQTLPSKSR